MGLVLDVGYAALLTVAAPYLAVRAARTGRYREGWQERLLGSVPALAAGQRSLWLHGVSLGEVQLLRPLVEYYRRAQADTQRQVVLSTSTLTGMQVARRSMPETLSFYCPLDFSWAVRRALARTRPDLIVLGELEVWPHLIGQAARLGIPVAVVNGRLSDRSFAGYHRFRGLLGATFGQLSLVAAQDEVTAERFGRLGVPADRVHVTGSLKFDNVNADRQHPEVQRRAQGVGLTARQRVLVVGSTQDPEEAAAVSAVARLLPRHPELKLILVPRHPERFDEVYQLLQRSSLKVLRRSQLQEPVTSDSWQVLLVDSVGELKWWWGLAELAIVGGSFGARGGQNMLEPAAYGAKVAFGPNTSNFREIVKQLLLHQAAWQLPNLAAIEPWLAQHLADPQLGRAGAASAIQLIRSHQGATGRTCQLLDGLLANRTFVPGL